MATLERMAIDYQSLVLFCVDQTLRIWNLIKDLNRLYLFVIEVL